MPEACYSVSRDFTELVTLFIELLLGFGWRDVSDVVGAFPNEASIMRLIGAVLSEQNDGRQTASCCMIIEALAQIGGEEIDPILSMTTKAP